ncbi:ferredoxin [Phytohabitans sp. LJ34]|uniref:ferredoxin n=1 Tax=Phytohabitans sp. LJ34 TaxID=3452217 RepID=UPI003F894AA2
MTAAVGFTSYGLLWLTAVWGIVLRGGRARRPAVYGVHMVAGLTALILGAVHGAAQLAAPSGPVRVVDLFVPFLNPADRLGLGAGVLGLELAVAATLAVLAQRRLGAGRWQAVHTVTYAAFTLVVAHILISGPDTATTAVWGAVVVTWLFTLLLRLSTMPMVARLRFRRGDPEEAYRPPVRSERRGGPRPAGGGGAGAAIAVDAGRCVRFGFCEREAPDLFRLRDDGRLAFRAAVPPGQVQVALRAAEACPARAIALSRAAPSSYDRWGTEAPARRRPPAVDVAYESSVELSYDDDAPEQYERDYDDYRGPYDRGYYDDRR